MAERRMFAKAIIGSGRFLRMPATARLLYYDLGMEADDDGIVEAFRVIKTTGASDDDLKILCAKGFVRILSDELVVLILDWKVNNYIQKDRYHKSIYSELVEKEGVSCIQPVSNLYPESIQPVSKMDTEDRLGKDRIDQDSIGKGTEATAPDPVEEKPDPVPYAKITEHFKKLCPSYPSIRGITGERKVKVAARWKENPDMETFDTLFRTAEASDFMKGQNNQRWKADFDWMMVAGNFMKVLEGKYNNRQPEVRGSFDTDEFFEASLLRSYGPENGGERK